MLFFKGKKSEPTSSEVSARVVEFDRESAALTEKLTGIRSDLARAVAVGDQTKVSAMRREAAELAEDIAARPLAKKALEFELRAAKRRELRARARDDRKAGEEFKSAYLAAAGRVREALGGLQAAFDAFGAVAPPPWLGRSVIGLGRRWGEQFAALGIASVPGSSWGIERCVKARLDNLAAALPDERNVVDVLDLATAERVAALEKEAAKDEDPLPAAAAVVEKAT